MCSQLRNSFIEIIFRSIGQIMSMYLLCHEKDQNLKRKFDTLNEFEDNWTKRHKTALETLQFDELTINSSLV